MTKANAESEVYQLHSITEDATDPGQIDSSGIFIIKTLSRFQEIEKYMHNEL